jgi:SEC-C motif-containing protein
MLARMADGACVCGSGGREDACCGPVLAGKARAATAEALMRSRYTAYVRGAIDYLVATSAPAMRGSLDRDAMLRWSRDAAWLGLEVRATERGQPGDRDGVVEFTARGVMAGAPFAQHERSRFEQLDGQWYYVDGDIIRAPAQRVATAGRNDPCPCGSGLKYKRCHG